MPNASVAALLANPPHLHFWGGEWKSGGLGPNQLALLVSAAESVGPNPKVIETGAGLSTLVLLAMGAKLTSFFLSEELRKRIEVACDERGITISNWTPEVGYSEFTFPRFLDQHADEFFDLVLIDGGHLVHTVFTDFTYGFAALRQGGIMLIDDLQSPAVNVLYQILKVSSFVEQVSRAGKTASFRKKVKTRLPGTDPKFFNKQAMDFDKVASGLRE
jgi:hypothetical protein